jgi:hypothetical protein
MKKFLETARLAPRLRPGVHSGPEILARLARLGVSIDRMLATWPRADCQRHAMDPQFG